MRREALKIELSEKLNELEQKMRKAMAWKVCSNIVMKNVVLPCVFRLLKTSRHRWLL